MGGNDAPLSAEALAAIAAVEDHYRVIIAKDAEEIASKYDASEGTYVILEGPRLATMGHSRISKGWRDFCASSLGLQSIEWTEGPFARESGGMAWVAGVVRIAVQAGGRSFDNVFRTTFVLLRTAGGWKITHEHVSVVHPDPYGIGDWLKK